MKTVQIMVAFSAKVDDKCDISNLAIKIPDLSKIEVEDVTYQDYGVSFKIISNVHSYETVDVDDSVDEQD